MANPDYLAACAEDTWMADPPIVQHIADRLRKPLKDQFARTTTARTASEFVEYLKACAAERFGHPDTYLADSATVELNLLREAEGAILCGGDRGFCPIVCWNLPFSAGEA